MVGFQTEKASIALVHEIHFYEQNDRNRDMDLCGM